MSIGILACHDESPLEPTLASVFRQSVFERVCVQREQCEVVILAGGGATQADRARRLLARQRREHPWGCAWRARVVATGGDRNAAWNRFVHEFSALEARALVSVHADILLHHRDAIWSLLAALDRRARVNAATGRRCEEVLFKERRSIWERLALAVAPGAGGGVQLYPELVCLRASLARKAHLPPGLGDGFADFLTGLAGTNGFSSPFDPARIALSPDAAHICAAPRGPREVLDLRRRRILGQTAAGVLANYIRSRSAAERASLAETLREHEAADPGWLQKLIAADGRRRLFRRLPPAVRCGCAFGTRWLRRIPEAAAAFALTIIAGLRARRAPRARTAGAAAGRRSDPVLSEPNSN